MRYIFAIVVLMTAACQTQIQPPPRHSLITFNFFTEDRKIESFRIWCSKKQRFNGKAVYKQLEMRENDAVTFEDGTSLYFSKGELFFNQRQQNLKPGNYILKDGHFYPGFVSSFDKTEHAEAE